MDAPDLKSDAGQHLLAHELAHVVQKRQALSWPDAPLWPAAAYEREADIAADAAVRGSPANIRLADPSNELRLWGEVGHYYTVYYVALAAGADSELARQLAFLAQLPDEISELDAKEVGLKWAWAKSVNALQAQQRSATNPVREWVNRQLPGNVVLVNNHSYGFSLYYEIDIAISVPRDPEYDTASLRQWIKIQKGGHALTGLSGDKEIEFRKSVLDRYSVDSFEFGLALHAFADSYAHQADNGAMFQAPLGHFLANSSTPGHRHKGCAMDHINRYPERYERYGVALYDKLREKIGSRKSQGLVSVLSPGPLADALTPRTPDANRSVDIKSDLNSFAKHATVAAQVEAIRTAAEVRFKIALDSYRPELEEAKPWAESPIRHRFNWLTGDSPARAIGLFESWAAEAAPGDTADAELEAAAAELGRRARQGSTAELVRDATGIAADGLAATVKKHAPSFIEDELPDSAAGYTGGDTKKYLSEDDD